MAAVVEQGHARGTAMSEVRAARRDSVGLGQRHEHGTNTCLHEVEVMGFGGAAGRPWRR
jgi:hypothetical protein